VVRRAGANADEHRWALRCAEAADRVEPGKAEHLLALGVAQYRTGQHQEALATLTRVKQLMRAKDEAERTRQKIVSTGISFGPFPGIVAEQAFLAMTHYRLGQKEQARVQLEELRRSMKTFKDLHWSPDEDSAAFVREAEALFQGGSP
jgi:tetratricopeptide (TPR) repeat protein